MVASQMAYRRIIDFQEAMMRLQSMQSALFGSLKKASRDVGAKSMVVDNSCFKHVIGQATGPPLPRTPGSGRHPSTTRLARVLGMPCGDDSQDGTLNLMRIADALEHQAIALGRVVDLRLYDDDVEARCTKRDFFFQAALINPMATSLCQKSWRISVCRGCIRHERVHYQIRLRYVSDEELTETRISPGQWPQSLCQVVVIHGAHTAPSSYAFSPLE